MRSQPPVGIGFLEHEDGASRDLGQPAAGRRAARVVEQAGGALPFELVLPGIKGMLGDAHQRREVAGGQAAASPDVQDGQPLLGVQDNVGRFLWACQPPPGCRSLPPESSWCRGRAGTGNTLFSLGCAHDRLAVGRSNAATGPARGPFGVGGLRSPGGRVDSGSGMGDVGDIRPPFSRETRGFGGTNSGTYFKRFECRNFGKEDKIGIRRPSALAFSA
jgi:hypothetical protein